MQEKAEFQRLHKTYRSAWQQFVMAVEWWQSQKPDDVAAQEFALAIEQAERLYRESRNELANYMISNASKGLSSRLSMRCVWAREAVLLGPTRLDSAEYKSQTVPTGQAAPASQSRFS